MAGNKIGGQKTRDKNLAKDPDFYKTMGALGGKKSRTGGFASKKVDTDGLTGQERARLQGAKGGRISRRTKNKKAE